jgi:hypothetical protein
MLVSSFRELRGGGENDWFECPSLFRNQPSDRAFRNTSMCTQKDRPHHNTHPEKAFCSGIGATSPGKLGICWDPDQPLTTVVMPFCDVSYGVGGVMLTTGPVDEASAMIGVGPPVKPFVRLAMDVSERVQMAACRQTMPEVLHTQR